jgi:hypothetical protein
MLPPRENVQELVDQLEYNQQLSVLNYIRDIVMNNVIHNLRSLGVHDLIEVNNIVTRMIRPLPVPMTGNNTGNNTENNTDVDD